MPTLFDAAARTSILDRVRRLSPESTPAWGKLNAPTMVVHLTAGLRQALGEIESSPVPSPMARWPINWLVIHLLPWPEGKAKAPSELLSQPVSHWTSDLARLQETIQRFGTRGPSGSWPLNSTFGRLSARSWGVLEYRHLDHHLRQFGV